MKNAFLSFMIITPILIGCSDYPKENRVNADIECFVLPKIKNIKKYDKPGLLSLDRDDIRIYHSTIYTDSSSTEIYIKYSWSKSESEWGFSGFKKVDSLGYLIGY